MVLSLVFMTASNFAHATQLQPWELKHQQLQQQRDVVFACLEEVHAALVARAQDEAPALLIRLSLDAPQTRASGYGLLPVIRDDVPHSAVVPTQTFYSLKWLEERFVKEFQKAIKRDKTGKASA